MGTDVGLDLPDEFTDIIRRTFGPRGRQWLEGLPGLIARAEERWRLGGLRPAPGALYNFVAFAERDGEGVVLKIGVPNRELFSEIAALRWFDGRGCARLLEADRETSSFLIERLRPGRTLASIEDDEEATRTAAGVMLTIRREVPPNEELINLEDWLGGFGRLRSRFGGTTGPIDESLVRRAEGLAVELMQEPVAPLLLHGDLHHHNVLSSGRGWRAIDPKGVIGPAGYEVGPFLVNPVDEFPRHPELAALLERRVAILAEHLGLERDEVRGWGLVYAVLSAWWTIEDNGTDILGVMQCARVLAAQ